MSESRKPSFSSLSFSEQQEQWRIFRAQHLEFQPVSAPQETAAPRREARPRPPVSQLSPQHANLDRIHARMSEAARHAGAFQSFPVRESRE